MKNLLLNTFPTVAVVAITAAVSGVNVPTTLSAGVATGMGTVGIVINGKRRREEEINRKQEEINNLRLSKEEAFNNLRLQLQEKEVRNQQLTAENARIENASVLSESLPRLQQEYSERQAELEKIQQDIINLQTSIGERTGELATVETRYNLERNHLETLTQSRVGLEDIIASLRGSNPNLEQLNQLRQQTEQLNQEKSLHQGHIESLFQEVTRLQEEQRQLNQVTGELSVRNAQLTQIQQEIEQLEQRNQELERSINEREILQREANALRGERDGLLLKIEGLENTKQQLEQVTGELSVKTAQLTQIQQEIEQLEQRNQELERSINEREILQREANALRGERDGLLLKIEQLENTKQQLEPEVARLASQQAELERIEQRIQQLEPSILQLEQQQQALKTHISELEIVRSTYDSLQAEQQNLAANIGQLRPKVESLQLQKDKILQEIREHQGDYEKILQYQQELAALKDEIRGRQNELRILIQREASINQAIIQLEEENSRLESKRRENLYQIEQQRIAFNEEREELQQELAILKGEIEAYKETAEKALQAYKETAEKALQALKEPALWTKLPNNRRPPQNEQTFISDFQDFLKDQGFSFPTRIIKAFHTSLKVQDISALAILAGISGTGKSELPMRYADFIGAQMLNLAVQPRWDSPQDLLGFYNYIEKKYKPTELMRGIYQYQCDQCNQELKGRIVIVLLDEMNLARIEYYFSEFLSKLETRRSRDVYLDLDVGSLPLPEDDRRVVIPKEFLFVGTMNEDETTQSLSDKVLDRSNVLTFGKPKELVLRKEGNSPDQNETNKNYITYEDFQREWHKTPDKLPNLVEKVKPKIDEANQIMTRMGHEFGHRVYQAIVSYVVNYPGVEDDENFKAALADQFGQKLLPKLRGVLIDEHREALDQLSKLIDSIGDKALTEAFERARIGSFGQFQWRGMLYSEEE